MEWTIQERRAFIALLGGAAAIGFAPVLVRFSMEEVGPSAAGFYRLLLALPWLWLWMVLEPADRSVRAASSPGGAAGRRWQRFGWFAVAGVFFAGDLAFWHWSLKLTSVANSTLLTNFAPLFVVIGARLFFGERITPTLLAGMGLAFFGGVLLMQGSFRIALTNVAGDLLGLITAAFYGAYLLTVKELRRHFSTARILALSGLVSCPLLLIIALSMGDSMVWSTGRVWLSLAGLALISHLGGQGLIAYALAHLPAGFSSVSLLFQAVVAALLAWVLLAEALDWTQAAGGAVIVAGIALASRTQSVGQPRSAPLDSPARPPSYDRTNPHGTGTEN